MDIQLSFSDVVDFSFWNRLTRLLDDIVVEQELPQNALHLSSNISKKGEKAGQEISKSICIFEPEYPAIKTNIDDPGKNYTVMNIQTKKGCELLIRNTQFSSIPLPSNAIVKKSKTDANFVCVSFNTDDSDIFPYIKQNILFCLKHYNSKTRSFGCCSRFIQCSNLQKCVHPNKLYATACSYRRNLENGNIFYGSNKNI